jgi:hypothetical protein
VSFQPYLRVLIYPIQFEKDPLDGVDRVLTQIADRDPAEFAAAIDAGLQSNEMLSQVLPQPHPEPVIRAYLAEIRRRLA